MSQHAAARTVSPGLPSRLSTRIRRAFAVLTGKRLDGYTAAKTTRLNKKLHGLIGNSTADAIAARQGARLQGVGRELYRNVPAAKRAARHIVQRVIGTAGIVPQFEDDAIDAAFSTWAESCGLRGESWRTIQKLVALDRVTAGNGFAYTVSDAGEFRVALFEPEQLSTPTANYSYEKTVGGITFDDYGRPVTYHVSEVQPGTVSLLTSVRDIAADRVCHFFDRDRPTALRGISDFATGAVTLHDLNDAVFAELQSMRMQGYAGLHYKPNESELGSETSPFGETYTDPEVSSNTGTDVVDTTTAVDWAPGSAFEYDGEVKLLDSNRPGGQFLPFVDFLSAMWAVSVGIPPHAVTGDYSKANYSSLRAAENTCRPTFEEFQTELIEMVLRRLVRRWLESAALAGTVSLRGRTVDDIMRGVQWQRPAYPFVDPVKDIQAHELMLDLGVETFDQFCAAFGKDGRTQRQAIKRATELDEQYDVKTPGLGSKKPAPAPMPPAAPGVPAVPPDDSEDEETPANTDDSDSNDSTEEAATA